MRNKTKIKIMLMRSWDILVKSICFFGCILALNNSVWASVNHTQSTESSGGQSHIERYWSICSIRPAFNNQISTDRQTLERDMHTKVPFWNRTFETFFYQRLYGNKRSLFLHLDPTLLLYCFKQWTVPHFIYEYFAHITGSFLSILETSGFPLEFTDTSFF